MTAHLDPDVRRQVFETVTQDEAMRILRSKLGRPWNAAVAEIIIEGLQPLDDPGDALAHVRASNAAVGR